MAKGVFLLLNQSGIKQILSAWPVKIRYGIDSLLKGMVFWISISNAIAKEIFFVSGAFFSIAFSFFGVAVSVSLPPFLRRVTTCSLATEGCWPQPIRGWTGQVCSMISTQYRRWKAQNIFCTVMPQKLKKESNRFLYGVHIHDIHMYMCIYITCLHIL